MHLKSKSTVRTLGLAEKAVQLAFDLAPEIEKFWSELHASVGSAFIPDSHDFAETCRRIGGEVRSLQSQLALAAVAAEIDPSRRMPGPSVRELQYWLTRWLRNLRDLFLLSNLADAADSIDPKRSYFRPIAGLKGEDQQRPPSGELLEALIGLDPKNFLEARLGMMAIANFPHRPATVQQQRRRKRRRRRSSPGAPSASFRRNRGYGDEDED